MEEDFLLRAPGRYTLYAGANDKDGVTITAVLPQRDLDKKALVEWQRTGAAQFILTPADLPPSLDALQSLKASFSESTYADYARLGVAREILSRPWLREKPSQWEQASAEIRELLQQRRNPAVMEHALFLAAMYLGKSRAERGSYALELERVHSSSGLLQRLEKLGVRPRAVEPDAKGTSEKAPPAEVKPITLNLERRGPLVDIPIGAVRRFEEYWRAVSARDIEKAVSYLAEDFTGGEGSKQNRKRVWDKHLKTGDVTEAKIRIERAEKASSYSRPETLPLGKAATYEGSLVVVEAVMLVRSRGTARPERKVTWVLKATDDGEWLLVSEYVHPRERESNDRPKGDR